MCAPKGTGVAPVGMGTVAGGEAGTPVGVPAVGAGVAIG